MRINFIGAKTDDEKLFYERIIMQIILVPIHLEFHDSVFTWI